ncbi:MAG: PE-PPE domain-containing protein [Actinomycetia bacterium]|nr:PE-PPE domain-containing protein [Actinomycetes bacterium]MCH9761513.1 PE-PPE domain-containing protein [Actinomycetes bacterium]
MSIGNEVEAGNARKGGQRAKCLAAAVASVPLLVLPAVGTAAADVPVFDALPPGAARVLTVDTLTAGGNADDLRGVVCAAPRVCTAVPYPYLNRPAGVVALDGALRTYASEQQIVYGYSQGARVAKDWLDQYAGTEDALSPSALSFILIGNPGRKYGGSRVKLGEMTPDAEYNVLDVSRQYDLSSDTPDNPLNLLAMINAYAGFSSIHVDYEDVDIYDPANYVWKEGNTTYVFVPTERLPMLGFLYSLGLAGFADSLDTFLRPQIEKAYDRSYLPAEPGWPPAEPESEPEEPLAGAEQPPTAALAMADGAPAADETSHQASVQDGAVSQDGSGSAAEGAEVDAELEAGGTQAGSDGDGTESGGSEGEGAESGDLAADGTEPDDFEDDALESEVAEDQDGAAAAAVSEDGDSPASSSSADSASAGNDTDSGGAGSSDSGDSADNGE